jgi:hypothetical protein
MPDSDDSDAVAGRQVDGPTVEPTVHELLLARIDEHCRLLGLELDQVRKATEQLAPERAPQLPECNHDGVGDGRRDPVAGPRPAARQRQHRLNSSRLPLYLPPRGSEGGCAGGGYGRPQADIGRADPIMTTWDALGSERIAAIADVLEDGETVEDHGLMRLCDRGRSLRARAAGYPRWREGFMVITNRRLIWRGRQQPDDQRLVSGRGAPPRVLHVRYRRPVRSRHRGVP